MTWVVALQSLKTELDAIHMVHQSTYHLHQF